MPAVSSGILAWARETAGLTPRTAVARIGIRDARGVSAVDRLMSLERGETEPTRSLLVRMARQYLRPLIAFYLATPPRRGDRGTDFRVLPAGRFAETDALIDALVRDVLSRQSMVTALLREEDGADPLPFVGCLRADGSNPEETSPPARSALRNLQELLGRDLSADMCYRQRDPKEAFALLRSRIEDAGVFVLLKGHLGSRHTVLEVDVYRGFAVADGVAPFVVINDQDSVSAWSFTLLHELLHLMLGQTGISGAKPGTAADRFCNDVAAEWLLPARTLEQIEVNSHQDIAEQRRAIGAFARPRNLSQSMVASRLLRTGRIDQRMFDCHREEFGSQRRRKRDPRRSKARQSEVQVPNYMVRRHRIGNALLKLTRRMMDSHALPTTRAARILGVRPAHVEELLGVSAPAA